MGNVHRIGVRDLVQHVLQHGDLSFEFTAPSRRLDAIRAHQKVQRSRPSGYEAEVSVAHTVQAAELDLHISGRIDGVWPDDGQVVIEEIKTTNKLPQDALQQRNPLHWAQLSCYAYLYSLAHGLDTVVGQLTYYQLDTGRTEFERRPYELPDLAAFFEKLVDEYLKWARRIEDHLRQRTVSLETVAFPFAGYRPGQREMAVAAFRSVRDGEHLMVQAATGIGKTMGVLFPALKVLGEGEIEKVFYLTARTTGRIAAQQAVAMIQAGGAQIKSLTLTAKDKICFCPDADCDPELCKFAKGYFDRMNAAMADAFSYNLLNRETVAALARRHTVCPFALSLDILVACDVVICDYNYAFDPRVYLRRFFSENIGRYAFLVDEAHNLVDRGREMFSATIEKEAFLEVRRPFKKRQPKLYRSMGRVSRWMAGARRAGGLDAHAPVHVTDQLPVDLVPLLETFVYRAQAWLALNIAADYRGPLLEVYFQTLHFLRIAEMFDDGYVVSYRHMAREFRITLYCIDPAVRLQSALERCRAAVFFSATLSPPAYFADLLGCGRDAGYLCLASPFPGENRCVLVAGGISTRLRQRRRSAVAVTDFLSVLAQTRRGNYLFYFPSYAYMQQIYERFAARNPEIATLVQVERMTESEREAFIERFTTDKNEACTGFAVLGGIFAEGIDLVGERLSGVAVVGVGLPAICWQRERIRDHFADKNGQGYPYAYIYPGINRVLQAAGRVIRSGQDRGVVMLIDDRYSQQTYKRLLPPEWQIERVGKPETVQQRLNQFWSRQNG